MARLWKTAPAFLIALVLALAVACGGGDGDKATRNTNDGAGGDGLGAPSEPIVGNVAEALGASVETFEEDVQSLRAVFSLHLEHADFTASVDGEFAFKDEDEFWASVSIDGSGEEFEGIGELGTFEALALGDTVYVNIPLFGGWFFFTEDDMTEDFGGFEGAFDGESPFDYAQLVDAFGDNVEDLGLESLNGGQFRHIRVSLDAADLYAFAAEATGDADSGGLGGFAEVGGDMVMNLWVHPDSFLPHQIEATGEFTADGESAAMMMTMSFTDYNEDVDLPDPPEDAKSAEELFGAFFGELEDAFEAEEAQ